MAGMESETFERKSRLKWSREGQQFDILKTIIAFANTLGGSILIENFEGDERMLDSARLDDFVNKYVDPPIRNIRTEKDKYGRWIIYVAKSTFAPHVISNVGNYNRGRQTPAFHLGQVYVRHSSKTEPATGSDLHWLIKESVSSWLSELGRAVGSITLDSAKDSGMPIRIVEGGPSLAVSIGQSHPYSAGQIGKAVGRTASWIGKLMRREGWQNDPALCMELGGFKWPHYRYSQAAFDKVLQLLSEQPNYNPYARY